MAKLTPPAPMTLSAAPAQDEAKEVLPTTIAKTA